MWACSFLSLRCGRAPSLGCTGQAVRSSSTNSSSEKMCDSMYLCRTSSDSRGQRSSILTLLLSRGITLSCRKSIVSTARRHGACHYLKMVTMAVHHCSPWTSCQISRSSFPPSHAQQEAAKSSRWQGNISLSNRRCLSDPTTTIAHIYISRHHRTATHNDHDRRISLNVLKYSNDAEAVQLCQWVLLRAERLIKIKSTS